MYVTKDVQERAKISLVRYSISLFFLIQGCIYNSQVGVGEQFKWTKVDLGGGQGCNTFGFWKGD